MEMNLTLTKQDSNNSNVKIYCIEGRIDADTAFHFDDSLKKVGDDQNIILDFKGVNYMNSFGIGILVDLQKRMMKAGGVIKISNLSPSLKKIFQITYLTKVFEIFEDLETAVTSFQ
jgi:anti-anti-sigma factor